MTDSISTILNRLMRTTASWVLIGMLAIGLAACSSSEEPSGGAPWAQNGEAVIPAVEVIKAQYGSLPLEERLSGTVEAENQVAIFPEISAPVVRVVAQNGDFVEVGAPLVYLRDTQFREQVRQAEAALRIAEAQAKQAQASLRELEARLNRTKQLAERQFQSEQELETLQAQVDASQASYEQSLGRVAQAEATLQEEREALRRTVVRAPISGLVGQRNAEVGMRADPSTRLYTQGNFEQVRVEVAITDAMIGRINVGQTALITTESFPDQPIRAEVSRISPFLEEDSFSAEAEIDVPNEEGLLRPGMFVQVDILYGESQQATLVPMSALYEDPNSGVLGVYVATSIGLEIDIEEPETYNEDNPPPLTEPTPMTFKEVDVLARGREMAGIAGVDPGAWVVTVGQNLLSNRGAGQVEARVRAIPWNRVVALQRLQDQDLLRQFMEKQQRLSRQQFNADSAAAAAATKMPDLPVTTAAPTTAP